ncbi:MAG: DUF6036 family nucleotidyltransferase [Bacteroidota bacterium]
MLNETVVDVCSKLDALGIGYMMSGSLAMSVYVPSRNSWDVDFVINLKEEDVPTFIRQFSEKYFIQPKTVLEEVKRTGMFNIIDRNNAFKVDFMILKNTEYRQHEFKRKRRVNYRQTEFWVFAIEDLIISKLIWIQHLESDMQKRDISSLLQYKNVDFNYLKEWITKLQLNTYNLL